MRYKNEIYHSGIIASFWAKFVSLFSVFTFPCGNEQKVHRAFMTQQKSCLSSPDALLLNH